MNRPNILLILIDDLGWRGRHARLVAWRQTVGTRMPERNPD
jgi:hypothetical protein